MAELSVKVVVHKEQLKQFEADIQRLRREVKEINIDVTSVQRAINTVRQLEAAQQRVEAAQRRRIATENQLQTTTARLATQIARTAQQEARYNREIQQTAREQERTQQTANRRAAAEATAHARIQTAMLNTERQAQRTGNAWRNMFSAFSVSNIVSNAITKAISSLRSYFNEAMKEMKALDLAATHYQQVMGSATTPEATKQLEKQAYNVGSKYGTPASQYMESVATYARAGYKDVADQLAELSMKTVIVGQTTQEVADQFLLTMDTAYKYGGSVKELSKVLDGASAIDSTYATTIEKIATGLGLVAPLAQQVHTSEAELTAAIGTITAATQRSGAEAARALRSLFLNIIGDTTTEIEDGVTATEESVASIQYLLEHYAKSALDAARATGEVVDPMEAIAALAKSMKEGLLTESQLMELLSGIGGKLRISQLVALVSNFDMYTDMINTYENAMGSADQKTEIYLDSWEAKVNVLKNTWTEFIAKSLNTGFIKGVIDFATTLLKHIGNLNSALVILGGTIASIRLSAGAFATGSAGLGIIAAITATVTTAIAAYNAYHLHRMQQLDEERLAYEKSADEAKANADSIYELYTTYYNAKKAYDDGRLSVQEYETAVRNLTSALGDENNALGDNIELITKKVEEQYKAVIAERDNALQAAKIEAAEELNKLSLSGNYRFMTDDAGDFGYTRHFALFKELDSARDADTAIKVYENLIDLQSEYLEKSKENNEEASLYASSYSQVTKVLGDYATVLEPVIANHQAYLDARQALKDFQEGDIETTEEEAEATEEAAKSFKTLADAVDEASSALERYKEASKTEKDDNFKSLAEAWNKAYEDIRNGQTNSNAVNSFIDLAFTPEQILNMRKQGIDAAELIAGDFWQSFFMYDGEFAKGEDAGSMMIWSIYNQFANDSGEIVNDANEVVAAFEVVDGTLSVTTDDFDKLGEAIGISGDVLAILFESLGVYSNTAQETADGIKEMAKAAEALNENGEIDLTKLFKGLYGSKSTKELYDLLDRITELSDKGEIKLDLSSSVEDLEEVISILDGSTLEDKLKEFSKGGNVDLTMRPVVKLPDGSIATTMTETFASFSKDPNLNVAINMTPILPDGTIMDDAEFRNYAEGVLQGGDDYLNLQIGAKFEGEDALADAEKAAQEAHLLQEQYYANEQTKKEKTQEALEELIEIKDKVAEPIKIVVSAVTSAANSALQYTLGLVEKINNANDKNGNKITATTSADGQRNFRGGLSLVNEEAPELIVENGTARIAGSGMPTLTYLQHGADVYTADETRAILGGTYPSQLFDGINAYSDGAGGYANNIAVWTGDKNAKDKTSSKATSGTDYSGGTGTEGTASTGSEKDEQLEALKNRIALLKSELDLMEERGDSLADQIKKQREIQGAYQDEINYLVSIGGDQTEINKLTTDWYKIENDIKKLQDEQIKEKQEKQIDLYEDKIALAKSELSLLEAQNKPVRQQIEKQRQISKLLLQQANYLKKIGGSQTDINKLLKERKDVEKDIAKLNEGLMDDLSDAVNNKIKKLNATRDKYVDSIQKQIDALKEKKDAQDAANESEEKHQALVEAWRNLKNAQKERTVRQYNAKTGQWEWVADASAVASAKEAYTSAKQDWKDYKANQSYEAKIAKLEAKQDKYTELFATKTDQWNKILEELADPVISISKALKNIENNATKDMKGDINALNKILKPLGYSISTKKLYDEGGILTGLGGIKATTRDETVLPPDITEKLLKPLHPAGFRQRMEELRYLYGANGSTMIGSNSNSIGSQHNGDLYTFGNVTLTETQARQTTMYDFVQAAKGLRSYSGRM